ncbi:carboxy terminal-processing peptidase [Pigmentibacter ruber]
MIFNKTRVFLTIAAVTITVPIGQYFKIIPTFQNANSEESNKKNPKIVAAYLGCATLSERMKDFLKNHYVFRTFEPELAKRTFDTFIKLLDPGKLYFTQDDINEFQKQQPDLFKNINNYDCRLITGENGIYERYRKRITEATILAKEALKQNQDFTKDEYIETDRKKIEWAKSTDELKERWRKTIKFIILNMKDSDDLEKIRTRLIKRYDLIKKDIDSKSSDERFSLFLNSFAFSLDPHSSFLTPIDNAQFQADFSLKFVGIGATLKSVDGYTVIDSVVPGGAAAKDGRLKKNDKIVAVDSGDNSGIQDVIEMDLSKVVQLIRGKEGTTVKLVILRKEIDGKISRFTIALKRAVVQIKDNEAKSDVMTINNKKIGILNLPSFYIDYKGCQDSPSTCRSSYNDMYREIKKLKQLKVDGIVLDLRRNGGGDLNETQKIVSLFIKNPIVTQVEDKDKNVRILLGGELKEDPYLGPLGILVSKYTASASEIVSGAVQDYGRGIIMGNSRTFGKGTVQTVIEVPGTGGRVTDGAIHVTIAKFFRPSGKSNQEKGILSDIVIPDIIEATEIGEKENDYALPYTIIKASRDFKPEKDLSSLIVNLQKLSKERIEKSDEFKKINEAIEKAKKEKNTLVSLKESKTTLAKGAQTKQSKEKIVNNKENASKEKNANNKENASKEKNANNKENASKENSSLDKIANNSENTGKNKKSSSASNESIAEDEDNFEFSPKVIRKNDIQLREAANILIDSIRLTSNNNKN